MTSFALSLFASQMILIPESARDWEISTLTISARLSHVLQDGGFRFLGDLHGLLYSRVLNLPGCGRKAILELWRFVGQISNDQLSAAEQVAGPSVKPASGLATIYIPPEACSLELDQLPLSTRLAGVFETLGLRQLGDLQRLTFKQILKTRNCGRDTLRQLRLLLERVQAGEFRPEAEATASGHLTRSEAGAEGLDSLKLAGSLAATNQASSAGTAVSRRIQAASLLKIVSIPPEACDLELSRLPLPTRLAGVLKTLGLHRLGDLQGLSFKQISRAKNCGQLTLRQLRLVLERVKAGEFQREIEEQESDARNAQTEEPDLRDLAQVVAAINRSIDSTRTRERDVLLRRFGDPPQSLGKIAAEFGVTRQRINQIAKRAIQRICQNIGPIACETIENLLQEHLASGISLTPELLALRLGHEADVCRFPGDFYLRLFSEMMSDLQASPERLKPDVQ